MLFAITRKNDIIRTNDIFFKKLGLLKVSKIPIVYNSGGGSYPITVSYSPKFDFWWGNDLENKGSRYWNPFGLKQPKPNSNQQGRCQINCSLSGVKNGIAGLFAKDANGKMYLLHSGNIGGGQKGVGKNSFSNFYTGEKIEVIADDKLFEFFVVTRFDSSTFYQNIVSFVKAVYSFKEYVKQGNTAGQPVIDRNPLKEGEYLGIKVYNLPARTVTASNDHAVITTKLIEQLRLKNFNVKRDQFRDAYTVINDNHIDKVFEVKSSLSRQSLYTAIGQLMLHSLEFNSKMFFVVDKDVNKDLVTDLKKIDIKCVFFKWKTDHLAVDFYGLESID